MKKALSILIIATLLTFFLIPSLHAQTDANEVYKKKKGEIMLGIRTMLTLDMDKGFQSIRGKEVAKQEDGTLVYDVKGLKFEMHSVSQHIFIRPNNPMGIYIASYSKDENNLGFSFQAFIEMNNPMTVEKDMERSTGTLTVYSMMYTGMKIGSYTKDESTGDGILIIGFL